MDFVCPSQCTDWKHMRIKYILKKINLMIQQSNKALNSCYIDRTPTWNMHYACKTR